MSTKVNYASEVELKSLLIRAKNASLGIGDYKWNHRIQQLVNLFIKTDSWRQNARNLSFRKALKKHIIWACERTRSTDNELTRLSVIVDLMIDRILTKPQFSGYTYIDEFHSDAQYKIFNYITNFDHRKISKISGDFVNAFAYVTQIIHNSIIYVISSNKKRQERVKKEYIKRQIEFAIDNPGIRPILKHDSFKEPETEKAKITKFYYNKNTFFDEFERDLEKIDFNKISKLTVVKPKECNVANYVGFNVEFKDLDTQI